MTKSNYVLRVSYALSLSLALTAATWAQRYRFEEGTGTDIIDSISGLDQGDLVEGATFSTDAPRIDDAPNAFSADFTSTGFGSITEPFVFHDASAGGAAGDATLEWLQKTSTTNHQAIYWTRTENNADTNRFNIFYVIIFNIVPYIFR